MLLRNLYLRLRVFFSTHKKTTNKITVYFMVAVLFYMFFNSIVMDNFLINKAKENQAKGQYTNAIILYNSVYGYYKFNHFSNKNKKIYLEIPNELSTSYFMNGRKDSAQKIILDAHKAIEKEYGTYSKENADFIRKSLIKYYLLNNNATQAKIQFKNLLKIYKKIGYNQEITADLICISGDISYRLGDNFSAGALWQKAFEIISMQKNTDYNVYEKIINRIATEQIHKGNSDEAIDIYKNFIETLKTANTAQNELLAKTYINIAQLYSHKDDSTQDAINNYEEAINLIKTLPKTSSLKQNMTQYYMALRELYNRVGNSVKVSEIDVEISKRKQFSFLY